MRGNKTMAWKTKVATLNGNMIVDHPNEWKQLDKCNACYTEKLSYGLDVDYSFNVYYLISYASVVLGVYMLIYKNEIDKINVLVNPNVRDCSPTTKRQVRRFFRMLGYRYNDIELFDYVSTLTFETDNDITKVEDLITFVQPIKIKSVSSHKLKTNIKSFNIELPTYQFDNGTKRECI